MEISKVFWAGSIDAHEESIDTHEGGIDTHEGSIDTWKAEYFQEHSVRKGSIPNPKRLSPNVHLSKILSFKDSFHLVFVATPT